MSRTQNQTVSGDPLGTCRISSPGNRVADSFASNSFLGYQMNDISLM